MAGWEASSREEKPGGQGCQAAAEPPGVHHWGDPGCRHSASTCHGHSHEAIPSFPEQQFPHLGNARAGSGPRQPYPGEAAE